MRFRTLFFVWPVQIDPTSRHTLSPLPLKQPESESRETVKGGGDSRRLLSPSFQHFINVVRSVIEVNIFKCRSKLAE